MIVGKIVAWVRRAHALIMRIATTTTMPSSNFHPHNLILTQYKSVFIHSLSQQRSLFLSLTVCRSFQQLSEVYFLLFSTHHRRRPPTLIPMFRSFISTICTNTVKRGAASATLHVQQSMSDGSVASYLNSLSLCVCFSPSFCLYNRVSSNEQASERKEGWWWWNKLHVHFLFPSNPENFNKEPPSSAPPHTHTTTCIHFLSVSVYLLIAKKRRKNQICVGRT